MKSRMKPIPALLPLSWLYGCGVVLRNLFFDWKMFRTERVSVPVISVGNITTGGTGKTPVVELLAKTLLERNIRAAIVSRGYKRATRGLIEVSDGTSVKATAREAGDEPFQLATRLSKTIVVVDEQRVRGARYAVRSLGVQAVVLDDGFQHRALHRDLDIVLIDASHSPFAMPLLPAGYRREPLSSLKRADAVLLTKVKPVTNVEQIKEHIRKYSPKGRRLDSLRMDFHDAKIFTSSFNVAAFRRAKTKFSVDLSSVRGKKAVAFCGIGQPESFRESLEDIGIHVSSLLPFEDHHSYTDADTRRIAAEQEKHSAEYIITTEKDIARLSSTTGESFLVKYPLFYVEMEVEIHQKEEWTAMINAVVEKSVQ